MNRKLFIVLMVMTLVLQPGCNKNDNPKESLPAVLARLDWGEGTTYVIGHKTPDADAVFSAIAYADLMKTLGYKCEARIRPTRCATRSGLRARTERLFPSWISERTNTRR